MMRVFSLFAVLGFLSACGTDSNCGGSSATAFSTGSYTLGATGYIPESSGECGASGNTEKEKCDLLTNPQACQTQ